MGYSPASFPAISNTYCDPDAAFVKVPAEELMSQDLAWL